ncbi:MAG TPA: ABC transporter ATP-binding protein [Micromonosporaceae bacterium]|jgi:putative ABC transport system ATP-binding protein
MSAGSTSDVVNDIVGASVAVNGLSKRFQVAGSEVTAVDDVTVCIDPGSVVAVTGPSGSGKSTLLHLIGGIETADSGTITVDGTEITALRPADITRFRRAVGFVFQRYHLLAALTALDNVIAPVLPYRVRYDKTRRAAELLAAVGLGDRGRSLPAQLSGGQQQRVAIARALMNGPRLLLADEPTGNLDSTASNEIVELLLNLRNEHAMTILIATHEASIASRCDRLLRLRDGRVVEDLDLRAGESRDATLARASRLRL